MKKKFKLLTAFVLIVIISICVLCLTGCWGDEGGSSKNKPKSVTVTLELNGGTNVSQKTLIGIAGEPMTIESPTREGFTFDRWYNGYEVVDNTVFPDEDMTLTARYYCNSEYEDTISYTSELNKQYGGSSGTWYFESTEFEGNKVEYLLNNHNIPVSIVVHFEAYCSTVGAGTWMGASATMTLTGSNSMDKFQKVTINNYSEYQNFTLTTETTTAMFIGTPGVLFRMVYDTNLGSTYCYYRNINVTVTYTVTQGSLV